MLKGMSGDMREKVLAAAKIDYAIFLRGVLGLRVPQFHLEWTDLLRTRQALVFLAPRDHGKSVVLIRAYAIWKAWADNTVTEILILAADQPSASDSLDKIRGLISSSDYLQGRLLRTTSFNSSMRRDNRSELLCANGTKITSKPVGSVVRGRHPQLLLVDDVLNERNSLTAKSRDKISKLFFRSVIPTLDAGFYDEDPESLESLARGEGVGIEEEQVPIDSEYRPQVIVAGTHQAEGDLYDELFDNPEFTGVRQKAILSDSPPSVLWPERYPYSALLKRKVLVGSMAFSKEYQNESVDSEEGIFPTSLIMRLCNHELSYGQLRSGHSRFIGVDLSVPGNLDGDFKVDLVIEEGLRQEKMRVVYLLRARGESFEEQLAATKEACDLTKVDFGYVEANLFQQVYVHVLSETTYLPLLPRTVGVEKHDSKQGVLMLRTLFENKRIEFPYASAEDRAITDVLIQEFKGVQIVDGKISNEEFHDDIVMAMWHAVCAARDAGAILGDDGEDDMESPDSPPPQTLQEVIPREAVSGVSSDVADADDYFEL